MSDTLRPWLADAASSYQRTHGRNLTFPKKGRLLQITQYNNYRNADVPAEKEKDVYAWAHDKAYEVLLRFDARAINAFEATHDSFTSYRYGLFHLLEYKFVLGTDYISEEPRSSTHVRTFHDLPKPRMFFLHVTKFIYISSKGEGNFAPRAVRPLEQITRNWKVDIEEDEEKKRGLVMQVTASQHTHDAPPRLEDMQAAAESLKAKRQSKPPTGSQQRLAKRQKVARSLNLNNMLPIPLELLLSSTPAPESPELGLIGEELIIQHPVGTEEIPQVEEDAIPANEADDMQNGLPSTPPPPPTSASSARTSITVNAVHSSAIRQLTFQPCALEPESHPASSPTLNSKGSPNNTLADIINGEENNDTTVHFNAQADATAILPEASNMSPEAILRAAALDDALAAAEAEVAGIVSRPVSEPAGTQGVGGSTIIHQNTNGLVSTSTPTKRSRKVVKLPRYSLDGEDEEKISQSQAQYLIESSVSPDKDHRSAEPAPSKFVEVDFFKDLASSPATAQKKSASPQTLLEKSVAAGSFYGTPKPLFESRSSPPSIPAESAAVPTEVQTTRGSSEFVSNGVVVDFTELNSYVNKRHSSPRAPPSEASSDGFEFVSFQEGPSDPGIFVKFEERGTSADNIPNVVDDVFAVPESVPDLARSSSPASEASASNHSANLTLQLGNISQQEIDTLLGQVKAFTKRKRNSASVESPAHSALGHSRTSESGTAANWTKSLPHTLLNGTPKNVQEASLVNNKDRTMNNLSAAKRSFSGPVQLERNVNAPDTSASSLLKRRRVSDTHRSDGSASPASSLLLSRSLLSNGLRASRSSQQSVDARKAIAERMDGISTMLESRGLTRRQGIDLWYCCSGDFEVASQIADSSLALVASIQSREGTSKRTVGSIQNGSSRPAKDLYQRCWTFEDDQVVENPNPEIFQIARKLQEIESRRGKGSVAGRRRFLSQDPLARKLVRKVRYPYDEDDSYDST